MRWTLTTHSHTHTPPAEISEYELELRKWLPSVKHVLIDCLLTRDDGPRTVFEIEGFEKLMLNTFKLFGADVGPDMKALYLAKLDDPSTERTFFVSF
jgi:hypothetical protein